MTKTEISKSHADITVEEGPWHCWDIAFMHVWTVVWHMLETRTWSPEQAWSSAEEAYANGVLILRSYMWKYYTAKRKEDPQFKVKGSKAVL